MAGGNRSYRKKLQRNSNGVHGLAEILETRRLFSGPSFYAGVEYAIGEGASDIITADLNGDGKADLITANSLQRSVSVLLNKGEGTFNANADYNVGQNPSAIEAADLNGDNEPDLIVANADDNTISVLMNIGQGRFADKVDYASGINPIAITASDFNGDGRIDIVVANTGDLRVFSNLGNGTFLATADMPIGATALAAADLNGDGRADLAVGSSRYENYTQTNFVRTLFNSGTGTFINGGDYSAPQTIRSIFVADMDHSGSLDLVTADSYFEVNVYLNNGSGIYSNNAEYSVSTGSSYQTQVAAGDFNGDGYVDIACSFLGESYNHSYDESYLSTPTILLNQRDGTLSAPLDAAFAYSVSSPMVAGDFNGDNRADLALGDQQLLYPRRHRRCFHQCR